MSLDHPDIAKSAVVSTMPALHRIAPIGVGVIGLGRG
jgi:hypothetical protein